MRPKKSNMLTSLLLLVYPRCPEFVFLNNDEALPSRATWKEL